MVLEKRAIASIKPERKEDPPLFFLFISLLDKKDSLSKKKKVSIFGWGKINRKEETIYRKGTPADLEHIASVIEQGQSEWPKQESREVIEKRVAHGQEKKTYLIAEK